MTLVLVSVFNPQLCRAWFGNALYVYYTLPIMYTPYYVNPFIWCIMFMCMCCCCCCCCWVFMHSWPHTLPDSEAVFSGSTKNPAALHHDLLKCLEIFPCLGDITWNTRIKLPLLFFQSTFKLIASIGFGSQKKRWKQNQCWMVNKMNKCIPRSPVTWWPVWLTTPS